jgi:hypothetical protein
MRALTAAFAVAAALLAGCKDVAALSLGGPGGKTLENFSCYSVGTAGATVSSGCINCRQNALTSAASAADDDLETAATLALYHPDDLAAQLTHFTVRARGTAAFGAGNRAGIVLELPAGVLADYALAVVTYLAGVPQESTTTEPVHVGPATSNLVYLGFTDDHPTTKAFDAVELHVVEQTPWVEAHTFKLHEFCADGAVD